MRKVLLLLIILVSLAGCSGLQQSKAPITVGALPQPSTATPAAELSTESAAWMLGDEFSQAAIRKAMGDPLYEVPWSNTKRLAEQLRIEEPTSPPEASSGNPRIDLDNGLDYLTDGKDRIRKQLEEAHSEVHSTLFDLAWQANAVAFFYEPGGKMASEYAEFIEEAVEESNLSGQPFEAILLSIKNKDPKDEFSLRVSELSERMGSALK